MCYKEERGIKEKERKAGTKRKGTGTKRSQEGEKGRERWRHMEIFRPLLLSEIQRQYQRNLLPLELHSLVSPVSTRELDCGTGGRKEPIFPRAALLKKAAVLSTNQSSMSRWTQKHRG